MRYLAVTFSWPFKFEVIISPWIVLSSSEITSKRTQQVHRINNRRESRHIDRVSSTILQTRLKEICSTRWRIDSRARLNTTPIKHLDRHVWSVEASIATFDFAGAKRMTEDETKVAFEVYPSTKKRKNKGSSIVTYDRTGWSEGSTLASVARAFFTERYISRSLPSVFWMSVKKEEKNKELAARRVYTRSILDRELECP